MYTASKSHSHNRKELLVLVLLSEYEPPEVLQYIVAAIAPLVRVRTLVAVSTVQLLRQQSQLLLFIRQVSYLLRNISTSSSSEFKSHSHKRKEIVDYYIPVTKLPLWHAVLPLALVAVIEVRLPLSTIIWDLLLFVNLHAGL
jgi:hypothetical protein